MRSCSSRRASTVIVALRLRGGSASAASDVLDIPECPPDAIGSRRAAAVLWVIFDLLQRLHGLRERGLGFGGAGFGLVKRTAFVCCGLPGGFDALLVKPYLHFTPRPHLAEHRRKTQRPVDVLEASVP